MSWSKRALELMRLGMSEKEACAFVGRERVAAERGETAPELPAVVLERLYGQQLLFAPDVAAEEAA